MQLAGVARRKGRDVDIWEATGDKQTYIHTHIDKQTYKHAYLYVCNGLVAFKQ